MEVLKCHINIKIFSHLKRKKPVCDEIQAFLVYCFGAELTIL